MSDKKQNSITHIRDYVRTNGDMSADGKTITYSCEELERVIREAYVIYEKEIGYSKEDVLKAGEIGEINHYDYKHIVSLLDEAKELNQKTKK